MSNLYKLETMSMFIYVTVFWLWVHSIYLKDEINYWWNATFLPFILEKIEFKFTSGPMVSRDSKVWSSLQAFSLALLLPFTLPRRYSLFILHLHRKASPYHPIWASQFPLPSHLLTFHITLDLLPDFLTGEKLNKIKACLIYLLLGPQCLPLLLALHADIINICRISE